MVERSKVPEYPEVKKDLLPWMKKAQGIIKKNKLLNILNITSKKDKALFTSYLVVKLINTRIFVNNKFLNPNTYGSIIASFSRPRQEDTAKINENAKHNYSLFFLDDFNRRFVEQSYASLEEHNRARAIELSINSLCSQAIVFLENSTKSDFKPTKEMLDVWTQTWKDKVKTPMIRDKS